MAALTEAPQGTGEVKKDRNSLAKLLGMTRNELLILLVMGSLLVCVLMAFEGYILYTAARAVPTKGGDPLTPPATGTPLRYIPAPSLTGWPTPSPTGPTVVPTRTRRPTLTPSLSPTPRPTYTPSLTPTPRPTRTPTATLTPTVPTPTATVQLGTTGNPVAMGSGFPLPGMGTLTVNASSWQPGQAGLVIVDLSFVCERPAGQRCNTSTIMLDAFGASGSGYERVFDASIPEPSFGSYFARHLYGGETERGNAGFRIDKSESSLMMRVRIFLQDGESFFWIGPIPSATGSAPGD